MSDKSLLTVHLTPEQQAAIDQEHAAYLASIAAWLRDKEEIAAAVEAGKVIVLDDWKREHAGATAREG